MEDATSLEAQEITGPGVVSTYTVNYHAWLPGLAVPLYGAAMVVATGQVQHAVVWRTVKEGSAARRTGGRPAYGSTRPSAEGSLAWLLPIGMLSPVVQVAPYATRYMHEYGATRELLAWIPVTHRSWAALNPSAVYSKPLAVPEYLDGRMITSPISAGGCTLRGLGTVVDTTEEAWDLAFAINLRGAFLASKYAVQAIAARGGGSVVTSRRSRRCAATARSPTPRPRAASSP